ncbi:MAG: hypothetical protein AB7M12_09160 [Hyphomonadaceae bacterium]
MSLRIVDTEAQLDRAYGVARAMLAQWGEGGGDPWQKNARDGAVIEEGASFSRRDDVYLFIIRDGAHVSIGAALTERDRELLRVEIPRAEPAADRQRAALAVDENDQLFLLASADELRRQHIRDPFRRLTGAPQVKRANISERDYVLIGPLSDPRAGDALLALAALHPLFDRHVEMLGKLAGRSDEREEAEVYRISPRVRSAHRVHAKVVEALFEKLRGAGFQVADLRNGPVRADFAVARSDAAVAFEIRADAELSDFLRALGQLVLIAPGGGAFRRALVLPAPREALGAALAPFEAAFRETGVWVLMYDFRDGEAHIWTQIAPPELPGDIRTLFA